MGDANPASNPYYGINVPFGSHRFLITADLEMPFCSSLLG